MRQITEWASAHRWQARILIVLLYQFLNWSGYLNGFYLSEAGITLPAWVFWTCLGASAAVMLLLPFANTDTNLHRRFYRTRVIHLFLVTCSCCLFLQLGNYEGSGLAPVTPASAAMVRKERLADKVFRTVRQQREQWHLKRQLADLRQWYRELSEGAKAGLIALTIIVAVAAVIGLAYLACSLACSGAEAIGIILLVAGMAGVVVGAIFLIRYIIRGPRRQI